ncbi:hypothetical protein PG994_008407 [Apiospora phragmitis]|uniref:Nephrocystin 3-like N-terminal domain-containing protein n=1 Tax=Apiospora phragmitis TaxID=2905665 RepID=A0ABR1USX5_9PEZI
MAQPPDQPSAEFQAAKKGFLATLSTAERNQFSALCDQTSPEQLLDSITPFSRHFEKKRWAQLISKIQIFTEPFSVKFENIKKRFECHMNMVAQETELLQLHKTTKTNEALARQEYERANSLCDPESGAWLFNSHEFSTWQRWTSEVRMLWIKGKPGCGKSVLASNIVENLSASTNGGAVIIDSRFEPKKAETSIEYALSSGQKGQIRASPFIIRDLFFILLGNFPNFYVVVDAIDECEPGDKHEGNEQALREELQILYDGIVNAGVKLVVLSRPSVWGLSNLSTMSLIQSLHIISALLSENLKRYCHKGLHNLCGDGFLPPMDATSLRELCNTLVMGADGMFLWVRLMFSYLRSPGLAPPHLAVTIRLQAIRNLRYPETLDQASVSNESQEIVDEFTAFSETILFACSSLVELSTISSQHHYRFIYATTSEFFLFRLDSTGCSGLHHMQLSVRQYFQICESETEMELGVTCLRYLLTFVPARPLSGNILEAANRDEVSQKYRFAAYASAFWTAHLKHAKVFRPAVPGLTAQDSSQSAKPLATISTSDLTQSFVAKLSIWPSSIRLDDKEVWLQARHFLQKPRTSGWLDDEEEAEEKLQLAFPILVSRHDFNTFVILRTLYKLVRVGDSPGEVRFDSFVIPIDFNDQLASRWSSEHSGPRHIMPSNVGYKTDDSESTKLPGRRKLRGLSFSSCGKNLILDNVDDEYPYVHSIADFQIYKNLGQTLQKGKARDPQLATAVTEQDLRHGTSICLGSGTLHSQQMQQYTDNEGKAIVQGLQINQSTVTTLEVTQWSGDGEATTQSLVSLPAVESAKYLGASIKIPETSTERLQVVLNKNPRPLYNMRDEPDRHFPALIVKDQRAIPKGKKRQIEGKDDQVDEAEVTKYRRFDEME